MVLYDETLLKHIQKYTPNIAQYVLDITYMQLACDLCMAYTWLTSNLYMSHM